MSSWPDVEGATRTWLRNHAAVTAVVGARVFFGIPKKDPTFPLVTVQRVGGGADPSDAPVDRALIQVDCWGGIDASGNGKKAEATAVVNAVRTALEAVGTDLTAISGVTLHGATVESVLWLPEQGNDRPRYTVTAEVAAICS